MEWLAVFLGGGLGSISRFGVSKWLGMTAAGFPMGTLVANLGASLILGFLGGWAASRWTENPHLKMGAITGFCGGFSTFSTFSGESLALFQQNKPALAVTYILASVLCCLLGVWLGQMLARTAS